MKAKPKQRDIASFFGGKPKAAATTPASPPPKDAGEAGTQGEPHPTPKAAAAANDAFAVMRSSSASKRKPAPPSAAAQEGPVGDADNKGNKLKRLRKAGQEEPAAAAAKPPTSALDDDLEDADAEEPPTAGVAGASPAAEAEAATPPPKRRPKRKPAAASAEASEAEEYDVAGEVESSPEPASEGEPELEAAAGAKDKKKRAKAPSKSPLGKGAKVDGVGALAVKAAALHAAFDLSSLLTWQPGEPVPFSFLADSFEAIAEESKRLVITGLLVNAFRAVIATSPEDLLPMVYLCTNRVAPAHEGLELGIGDATLVKALAQATGRKEAAIKKDYDTSGDLGVVAAAARATQRTLGFAGKPAALTVRGVFAAFKEIATAEGKSSQERKKGMIVRLLVAAKQNEAGYVMRALQGKLRIGLAEQTVLVALAHATLLQREGLGNADGGALAAALEEGAQTLKRVYSECPSYDEVVPAMLSAPLAELPERVHFRCGVPVKPMLAKPTAAVSEVLDKFSDQAFTCEYKYDGERAQIHVLEDGSCKVYSRNSEDNTGKYPDIAALFPAALAPGIKSVVLDAEAVAYDPVNGKILPFQILSTRARKDVSVENIKVAVCVFVFDCLYVDGRVLLQEALTVRRAALEAALLPVPGKLELATAKTSHDVEELSRFLDESVDAGTEGLIVKTLADGYEPSRRSSHWLKLKKDYLEGVGDTLDLVPIGAWHGRGKRTGVYGAYLVAIWDPDTEEFQSFTKLGTGFSEVVLKQLAEGFDQHVLPGPKPYYRVQDSLTPDVWFDAATVWEVKCADLSLSPKYTAAMGLADPDRGVSTRFPRFLRVRDDKGPEDSTSPEQVAEMFKAQKIMQQKSKPTGDDGGDDY